MAAKMRCSSSIVTRLRVDLAFAPLDRSLSVYYGDAARDAAMDRCTHAS